MSETSFHCDFICASMSLQSLGFVKSIRVFISGEVFILGSAKRFSLGSFELIPRATDECALGRLPVKWAFSTLPG